MKKLFTLLIITFLLGISFSPSQAEPTPPWAITEYPPRPPSTVQPPAQKLIQPAAALALPPLKAVLLVGPIDGNDGDWTRSEIANMELAANELVAQGVNVMRFYPGTGTSAEIEAAVNGAHFLLYRGHGVYDGNLPYPNVGGFMLSSGYYSPDHIRSNWHLAPNAIVMIYGCFASGSSSAEGDTYDIGITEAARRVAQYSDPFFDVGAAGYYANWFGNAFEAFLGNLFAGQTLGQAYENYFDFNGNTVFRTNHPDHTGLALWIDKDNWDYWQYNNAFAGKPDLRLVDLFKEATLGGIPNQLDFVVDVRDTTTIEPPSYQVTPVNASGTIPITWSVVKGGNWFNVSSLQGTTPTSSFSVTPISFDTTRPGKYAGTITVTATSPADTENPVQTIQVGLTVLAPELGGLPERVDFFYSIPDGEFLADSYTLKPLNTGSQLPLELQFKKDGSWIQLSAQSGISGQEFIITAGSFDPSSVATYSGSITVSATSSSPNPVYQSPRQILLNLHVVDRSFTRTYLVRIFKP